MFDRALTTEEYDSVMETAVYIGPFGRRSMYKVGGVYFTVRRCSPFWVLDTV